MKVFINLDTGLKAGGAELVFKNHDLIPLGISFLSGTDVIELPNDATGRVGIKKTASDSSLLVYSGSWSKNGIGPNAIYTFDVNFNTQEVATALGSSDSISAVMEVKWSFGGYSYCSNAIPISITKNIITGNEPTPEALASSPFPLNSSTNILYGESGKVSSITYFTRSVIHGTATISYNQSGKPISVVFANHAGTVLRTVSMNYTDDKLTGTQVS